MKTKNKIKFSSYVLTAIVVLGLFIPIILQSQANSTTLQSNYVKITHAVVSDQLNNHDYAVYIGAKWERINGYYGDRFYFSDNDYEDNLDSSSSDYPDDWYQMGSSYDLDHTVGSSETSDKSTARSWQEPDSGSGYELIVWVKLVWKYTFIFTTYHYSYDKWVIYGWTHGGSSDHEFWFDGDYGEDFAGAVTCTIYFYD